MAAGVLLPFHYLTGLNKTIPGIQLPICSPASRKECREAANERQRMTEGELVFIPNLTIRDDQPQGHTMEAVGLVRESCECSDSIF